MMETAQALAGHCGLFALLAVFGVIASRGQVSWIWLGLAFGLFLAENFAVTLGWGLVPALQPAPGSPNWLGKAVALVVVLALGALLFRGRWRETGVTFVQGGPAPLRALAVAGLLAAAYAAIAWRAGDGREIIAAAEFAQRATVLGIEEEVFWRGVLFAALDRAFKGRMTVLGARVGWSLAMSAVLFAAQDLITASPDLAAALAPDRTAALVMLGFALGWVRAASGSVLLPVLVHAWANVSVHVL